MRLATFTLPAAALTAALLVSACGAMPGFGAAAGNPANVATEGGALVGPNKMTLYTFDKDPVGAGKSLCNGPCAANWPPLAAPAGAAASGDWSVVTRDDGARQWAFKGKPLYFWAKDQKPGDKTGDGFNGVWRAAAP